ncbi:MAG: PDZ domain-containing protein [Ignavibacteriales bacterium]|nr:PDZ domain-containing protein [Ignavibacteriales bacterium]
MFYRAIVIVLILAASSGINSQELRRKVYFGIQQETITDSARDANNLPQNSGVIVKSILPGGTAAAMQIQANDILISVNMQKIQTPLDLPKVVLFEGDEISITISRNGKQLSVTGKAIGKPKETSADFDVIYDAVPYKSGLLRAIITKPKQSGKYPAVLLVQGYTCSPVCDLPDWHPYRKLTDGLTAAGYIVVRVEKPGVGETMNVPDCVNMDIFAETDAFAAAYLFMKNLPSADTSQLYIWGHSMGGKIGPAIAAKYQPAGVVVYGTTHEYWSEYLFRMIRAQNFGFGTVDYAQNEKDLAAYRTIFYRLCVEKKNTRQVAEEDTVYKSLMLRDLQWDGDALIFGRSYKFFSSVEDMNTTLDLLDYNGKFLSMYGEADVEVFEPNAMARMAEIINYKHPGNGTFVTIPKTDHAFLLLGSLTESYKIRADLTLYRQEMRTKFNPRVVEETVKWIQSQGK